MYTLLTLLTYDSSNLDSNAVAKRGEWEKEGGVAPVPNRVMLFQVYNGWINNGC